MSHLLFLFYLLFLHDSETITHNTCTFNGKGARCHAKSTRTEEKIWEKGKALVEVFSFKLHDSETITHNRCTFNGKGARCHAKSTRTEEKIWEKGKALVEGS